MSLNQSTNQSAAGGYSNFRPFSSSGFRHAPPTTRPRYQSRAAASPLTKVRSPISSYDVSCGVEIGGRLGCLLSPQSSSTPYSSAPASLTLNIIPSFQIRTRVQLQTEPCAVVWCGWWCYFSSWRRERGEEGTKLLRQKTP